MFKSRWRITYNPNANPIVLLDFGDVLQDELENSVTRAVQRQPYVRATDGRVFGRGNKFRDLSFVKLTQHADEAAAALYVVNAEGAYPCEEKRILIEVSNECVAGAMVAGSVSIESGCIAGMQATVSFQPNRTWDAFQLVGGKLS